MDDPIFGPHSPIPYVILESPIEISDEASSGPHLVLASPISDVCSETEIESSDEEKAQLIDGVYRFPSKDALAKITERAKQATMAVLREHYARAKPEVSSESNMCGQCTGRSLRVDPAPIYFKGGGGRPGIYFKAGGATTEGPGLDPQSTFTPHLLPGETKRQRDRKTERNKPAVCAVLRHWSGRKHAHSTRFYLSLHPQHMWSKLPRVHLDGFFSKPGRMAIVLGPLGVPPRTIETRVSETWLGGRGPRELRVVSLRGE